MVQVRDPRPVLTPALEHIIADLIRIVPELSALVATDILIVGLAAHGSAVASVRALDGVARTVNVDKHRRRVELGLRPGFFFDLDAPRRLVVLVHELLHLDPHKPGALLEHKRHRVRSQRAHDAEARALAEHYLAHADPIHILCLAHDGEVLLRQWRRRPSDDTARQRFTDADVFAGPVQMTTPHAARGGWW